MKKIAVYFLCFCTLILCSCSKKHSAPVYRAVTQVDIVTNYQGEQVRRLYNTPDKMRPVLLYLRLLKPYGKPVTIDESAEDMYWIRISLSDGEKHYYRQVSHRYFSRQNGPFKEIDPGQAANLYAILQKLPSDL